MRYKESGQNQVKENITYNLFIFKIQSTFQTYPVFHAYYWATTVNIDVVFLLEQNPILYLSVFVVLSIGLAIGKIPLVASNEKLNFKVGVPDYFSCDGSSRFFRSTPTRLWPSGSCCSSTVWSIEAGPNFFGIFFRDGKHYLILSLIWLLSTAIALTYFSCGETRALVSGLSAGMMAGALTATPILVGAGRAGTGACWSA